MLALGAILLSAKPPAPPEETEDQRTKVPTWEFTTIFENTRDLRGFGDDAQKRALADIERALAGFRADQDPKKLGKIFEKLSFEDVQLLAKGGKQMPAELSNRIAEFKRQFEAMTGVDPKKAGISTLSGADFYPDWRQKQTTAEYSVEAARVFEENRKDASAYRSEGQLKSQVEGRGYEAIQEHHKRVRELQAARDRLEAAGGDPASLAAMEKEILHEYRPVLSEAEARIYEGMGREAVEKMLDDRPRLLRAQHPVLPPHRRRLPPTLPEKMRP